MKIISKLLGKIRKNKHRLKKIIAIIIVGLTTRRYGRHGKIDLIPINSSSNSSQQAEHVPNYVEEDMQLVNIDGKIKYGLNNKSSSRIVKTGSGILMGNQQIAKDSKDTVNQIRGGDLGKSGPGPRANAGVRKTGQTTSSGSSIFVKGYIPQNIYCNHYHKDANKLSCRQAHKSTPNDQGKCLKMDQNDYCAHYLVQKKRYQCLVLLENTNKILNLQFNKLIDRIKLSLVLFEKMACTFHLTR